MTVRWEDHYPPLREPDQTLRRMTPDDLPAAVALVQSVGWGQEIADWTRIFNWSVEGCFVIEEADRGIIGTISTTPYGRALGWIGMLVIAPDRQRRGLGGRLMRAALDFLIERETACIMLDASGTGRPLYERLGFRTVCKVERWEGRASTYLGARARPMRAEDTAGVLKLDPVLFGTKRTHILMRLLEEFPDLAWVDYDHGRLAGYMLGRRTRDGIYLGPWMSQRAASAERLLRAALEHIQGQHVTMNIPDYNGRGLVLAADHNLKR
ncbi:MAG: GNAT family N-acetyltransferase, partial [Anaerolineae bacterium]|nr:GNAT family N-acetyltransferase [Anaerolineae bacterium]